MAKGMGWKAAAQDIMKKQGVSKESADKMLGAGAHGASKQAIRSNPNLRHVPGVGKPKKGK